jgi:hypothetical protein
LLKRTEMGRSSKVYSSVVGLSMAVANKGRERRARSGGSLYLLSQAVVTMVVTQTGSGEETIDEAQENELWVMGDVSSAIITETFVEPFVMLQPPGNGITTR